MFKLLDVALAFASIMLLLSLLVTSAVQLLISIFGIRGRNLKWAVSQLLQHCDRSLGHPEAIVLTETMLRDPLVSTTTNRLLQLIDEVVVRIRHDRTKPSFNFGRRPPVRLEARSIELALRRLKDGNWPDQEGDLSDNARLQTSLSRLFAASGPTEQRESDSRVGESGSEKKGGAGTEEPKDAQKPADTKLAVGLADWFDVAMAASGERFKLWARWLTAAAALGMGVGLQVNASTIWQRLSTDQELREKAIANIGVLDSIYGKVTNASTVPAEAVADTLERQVRRLRDMSDDLQTAGILEFTPLRSLNDLRDSIWGDLATALLLSLGAPFWYSMLAELVGLKGAAKKPEQSAAGLPNAGSGG